MVESYNNAMAVIQFLAIIFSLYFIVITILGIYGRSRKSNNSHRQTIEVEISDPYIVEKLQNLYSRQDLYNKQHKIVGDKLKMFEFDLGVINGEIDKQHNDLEKLLISMPNSNKEVIKQMYEGKIVSLLKSKSEIEYNILKLQDKQLDLIDKSNKITQEIDNIGIKEYKKQNIV